MEEEKSVTPTSPTTPPSLGAVSPSTSRSGTPTPAPAPTPTSTPTPTPTPTPTSTSSQEGEVSGDPIEVGCPLGQDARAVGLRYEPKLGESELAKIHEMVTKAILANKGKKAIKLLKSYDLTSNIDKRDAYGRTLVYLAALNNLPMVIRKLAKIGANTDIADNGGCTPLMLACYKLKQALRNTVDEEERRHQAVKFEKCVDILIKHTDNINICNRNGHNVLHIVCMLNLSKLLEKLLKVRYLDVTARELNPHGEENFTRIHFVERPWMYHNLETPLSLAAAKQNTKIVKLLVNTYEGMHIAFTLYEINALFKYGYADLGKPLLLALSEEEVMSYFDYHCSVGGGVEALELYEMSGANICRTPEITMTRAIRGGDLQVVDFFINKFVKEKNVLSKKDIRDFIKLAIKSRNNNMVVLLKESLESLFVCDLEMLINAISYGLNLQAVKAIFEAIEFLNEREMVEAMKAAAAANLEVFVYLMEKSPASALFIAPDALIPQRFSEGRVVRYAQSDLIPNHKVSFAIDDFVNMKLPVPVIFKAAEVMSVGFLEMLLKNGVRLDVTIEKRGEVCCFIDFLPNISRRDLNDITRLNISRFIKKIMNNLSEVQLYPLMNAKRFEKLYVLLCAVDDYRFFREFFEKFPGLHELLGYSCLETAAFYGNVEIFNYTFHYLYNHAPGELNKLSHKNLLRNAVNSKNPLMLHNVLHMKLDVEVIGNRINMTKGDYASEILLEHLLHRMSPQEIKTLLNEDFGMVTNLHYIICNFSINAFRLILLKIPEAIDGNSIASVAKHAIKSNNAVKFQVVYDSFLLIYGTKETVKNHNLFVKLAFENGSAEVLQRVFQIIDINPEDAAANTIHRLFRIEDEVDVYCLDVYKCWKEGKYKYTAQDASVLDKHDCHSDGESSYSSGSDGISDEEPSHTVLDDHEKRALRFAKLATYNTPYRLKEKRRAEKYYGGGAGGGSAGGELGAESYKEALLGSRFFIADDDKRDKSEKRALRLAKLATSNIPYRLKEKRRAEKYYGGGAGGGSAGGELGAESYKEALLGSRFFLAGGL